MSTRHELTVVAVAGELMLTDKAAVRSVKTDLQMIEAGQVTDLHTPADLIGFLSRVAEDGSVPGSRLA